MVNFSVIYTKESGEVDNLTYSRKVVYIKEFKLLTSADIIQYRDHSQLMNFRLIEFPLDSETSLEIYKSLTTYLTAKGLRHRLIPESSNLEVFAISDNEVKEIANNFDIVLSITSSLAGVIRPSEFNIEERGYGFDVKNGDEDLPIIGILDTGISNRTPLAALLINDTTFNLTESSPFEDNANQGYGHGTSVAALAALGRTPYLSQYRGSFNADAKLLSIKILDGNSGFLSELDVLTLLKNVKTKYPQIKLFVLTVCYMVNKRRNEDFSTYAYELDKFSHDNDCLIFICTANNDEASLHNSTYDLNYFSGEITNLCSPAESLNNVVVGGAAHSIKDGVFHGISNGKEFPTLFTRKSHFDFTGLFPKTKQNKNYFKPDIIECAGDYEQIGRYIDKGTNAPLDLLSANPSYGFYQEIGTSFSTPLVANIAAQIQKLYPNIRAQTIKALIINGASLENIRFAKTYKALLNKTAGHGFATPEKSIFSDDNSITFVIEEEIKPEEVKIIPLNFPKYLSEEDLGKKRGILSITATLCFDFEPILNNQLAYCPIHIAYCFFKNHSGDDILKKEEEIKSKLKSNLSWSQNARHKAKPIPFFNTQKISFKVSVANLTDENSTFKLAVNCRLNPQLLPGTEARYNKSHPFSIIVTVKEELPEARQTGRLYADMIAVNEIENIVAVELEAEAEG